MDEYSKIRPQASQSLYQTNLFSRLQDLQRSHDGLQQQISQIKNSLYNSFYGQQDRIIQQQQIERKEIQTKNQIMQRLFKLQQQRRSKAIQKQQKISQFNRQQTKHKFMQQSSIIKSQTNHQPQTLFGFQKNQVRKIIAKQSIQDPVTFRNPYQKKVYGDNVGQKNSQFALVQTLKQKNTRFNKQQTNNQQHYQLYSNFDNQREEQLLFKKFNYQFRKSNPMKIQLIQVHHRSKPLYTHPFQFKQIYHHPFKSPITTIAKASCPKTNKISVYQRYKHLLN